jgi:hypothetical protein
MSADPNKKSSRNFQCRDVLWETFEQMARELECSVDYLINEAMKQYARQRSYGAGASRTPFPGMRGAGESVAPPASSHAPAYPSSAPNAPTNPVPPPPQMRSNAPLGGAGPASSRLPPPPLRPGSGIGGSNLPPPRPPPGLAPPQQSARATHGGLGPPSQGPRSNIPPPANRTAPPPLPRTATPLPPPPGPSMNGGGFATGAPGAALSVIYQGDKVSISKDRFVIGRGKQSSDLTLKDPNVSRQHAMIEFQNGVYFMVDMGSTNGVEYNGQRIARKQIAEGDVFRICDHEMRFTYR